MIGRFCPDFARVDARAIIDVFSYTHQRKDTGKLTVFDKKRLAYIRAQGWRVLVVWQSGLKHIGKVAAKIKRFDEKVLANLSKNGPTSAHIGETVPGKADGNTEGSRRAKKHA